MRRIAELDGLRGIAAIAIVAFHYSYPGILYDKFLYIGNISLDRLLRALRVSHQLDHPPRNVEQKGFLRAFYFRRGLRIYPDLLPDRRRVHGPGSCSGPTWAISGARPLLLDIHAEPPALLVRPTLPS